MQHEFRAKSLTEAVSMSVSKNNPRLTFKKRLSTGETGNWENHTLSKPVTKGTSYTISYTAEDPFQDDAGLYSINIISHDGHGNSNPGHVVNHGSHSATFTSSGSWRFTAKFTGTATFTIKLSSSAAKLFGKPKVDVSIN